MPGRDYAVARVRGLRSRLLRAPGVLEILAAPSDAARVTLLRASEYGEVLPPGPLSPREASWALRAFPPRELARVLALFDDDARAGGYLRALGSIDDARALKTVLRGVARGVPSAQLLELVTPSPQLDEAALRELVAQSDVKSVADLLATWGSPFAVSLLAALPEHGRGHDLVALELALDRGVLVRARAAAAHCRGADARVSGEVLASSIDAVNAATLLALSGRHAASELWLPGGASIDAERFDELSRMDPAALHAALDVAGFSGEPVIFERLAARRRLHILQRMARLEPRSLAVPLLYLAEREEEVRRLRLVLEGAALGLAADEIGALVSMSEKSA